MLKFFIYDLLEFLSYAFCEIAFRFDCWGLFGWWFYPWGCNIGGIATDFGQHCGILIDNPNKSSYDEPLLIDIRTKNKHV